MRIVLFSVVAALHILLILFLVIDVKAGLAQDLEESARVMKLADLDELPPPPPPEEEQLPLVEAIAETMIETDTEPLQIVVAPGTLTVTIENEEEDYLPQFQVSIIPKFDEKVLKDAIVYPPIAQRSGIQGSVILELFIDRTGLVRQIVILKEEPPDRGFGEAAVRAFTGIRCVPALANGEPVSCRFRYPVHFRLR